MACILTMSSARGIHWMILCVVLLNAVKSSQCARLQARATIDSITPKFPIRFSVDFNETTITKTEGSWQYDSSLGLERVYRSNGKGDRYCGTTKPLRDTPCVHLVSEGVRYLIFPELADFCCKCCNAAHGCGILSPNWLEGASFEGTELLRGNAVYKFKKGGLQGNYYFATADAAQVPVELDQVPNDYQSFDVDTYSTASIAPGLFEVPDNCQTQCPFPSFCRLL